MNIMVDLETLGTVPGCAILSIGAVVFSTRTGELGSEYYGIISRKSCEEVGLHVDPLTEEWWRGQGVEAQKVLAASAAHDAPHIEDALGDFNSWMHDLSGGDPKQVYMWGNGADFDNALLAAAYRAVLLKPGWASYNGRCYRSLKNLHPLFGLGRGPKLERSGTHHNALDDAKSQARHAIAIVRDLRQRVVGLEGME